LGGSQQYVEKLTERFAPAIRLDSAVTGVERTANGVVVTTADDRQFYDQVIFATHSDQALAILQDADEAEKSVLSGVRYLPNQVYLHRDRRLMPRRQSTWSAWNYITDTSAGSAPIMTVSYWMNRLQNIDESTPLFVTLNPPIAPAEELTFGHYEYDHPQYDHAALQSQKNLPSIQGKRDIWFCGAWTGYGFHEDGLQSALRVCRGIAQLTENSEMITDFPLMAAE
jgi:predicted NAD/FAD-binding protein